MSHPETTRTEAGHGLTLELERTLPAPPERVFRAWTDPGEMGAWFAPNPDLEVSAEVELRVEGRYRIAMGEHVVGGVYREIQAPSRLVFTWRWEGSADPDEMLVTVELEPHREGTRLRLRHQRLADAESRANHAEGWELCLPRLEAFVRGGA